MNAAPTTPQHPSQNVAQFDAVTDFDRRPFIDDSGPFMFRYSIKDLGHNIPQFRPVAPYAHGDDCIW